MKRFCAADYRLSLRDLMMIWAPSPLQAGDARQLVWVAGFFLLAGYGLFRLYRNPRYRTLAIVLIVFAVLVLPPLIYVELAFHE